MPKIFTFGNEVRVTSIPPGVTLVLNVGCGSLCAAYWGVGLSWTAGCFGGVAGIFFAC